MTGKMSKAIVILNEQHQLMEEQASLLDARYEEIEIISVPATGWTLLEQKEIANVLSDLSADKIFASPVPYLLMQVVMDFAINGERAPGTPLIFKGGVLLFHNDRREKLELPGGKIINVIAKAGWQLVPAA